METLESFIVTSVLLDVLNVSECSIQVLSTPFAECIQADTPEETRRGLEGRTFLRAGEALLLRYPRHSEHGEDGPVGDVMQNTPQESECSSSSIAKLYSYVSISLQLKIKGPDSYPGPTCDPDPRSIPAIHTLLKR